MAIVIRKRISLEFLGEQYKDSWLEFKSIPLKDYEGIIDRITKNADDNKKAISYMLQVLDNYFLDGIFEGEKVTKADIPDLDQETVLTIFQRLTGQLDPKAEGPLTSISSTSPPPQ